jgi:D-alanyl-D-alanine carboxypeptidase
MHCVSVGASVGLRKTALCILSLSVVAVCLTNPAEARWRKRSAPSASDAASAVNEPRYADIVVDANTGDVLHAVNADSLRHPASLTKVMTLYLLFERLEAGKLKLSSSLPVSEHASEQAPSKLGLQPGQTIEVEDAIKALVTKSANDVAVVVAEALGGTEDDFAKLMTRKARALGMTRTVYVNASGLPDDDQVTTARDQALLAMAIQDRFPKYYAYFSTGQFTYRGNTMRNHNHLLGRVAGVDGIKTGYTRASGFNLITSVHRGPRYVVSVVFGGRTAAQRDARMRSLIEAHADDAATKRTAPKIAEAAEKHPPLPAKNKVVRLASAESAAAPVEQPKPEAPRVETTAAIPAPRPGSTEPIKPLMVKTLSVKPGAVHVAAVSPLSLLSPQPVTGQSAAWGAQAKGETHLPPPPPGSRPGVLGVLPAAAVAQAEAKPAAPIVEPKPVAAAPVPHETKIASAAAIPVLPTPPAEARMRSGWIIQVGAFDDEAEAKQRLTSARNVANKLLGNADPFTEPVSKGDKTLYRARFAGLRQDDAEAACKQLRRNDFVCIAIRN